jgi:hypothetical protein
MNAGGLYERQQLLVIGGEFGSMNFHKLVEGSAQVQGPFKTRKEAEDAWRTVSKRTVIAPACASRSWKSRTARTTPDGGSPDHIRAV